MGDAASQRLANYGKWTYRGAWLLEITAALIGLATGLVLGIQAYLGSGLTEPWTLVLASAPFFMVALAELTKIPIATLLYAVSWPWKPLLLVFLAALALITFETVVMGLERAATLRQRAYDDLVKQISILQGENSALASTTTRLIETDEVGEAQKSIQEITGLASSERKNLQEQLEALDQQIASGTSSAALTSMQARLKEAEDTRSTLIAERDTRIRERVAEFQSQRESFVTRIREAKDRGETALAEQLQQQLDRLKNPGPEITREYAERLSRLNSTISDLERQVATAQKSAEKAAQATSEDLAAQRSTLVAQLAASNSKWENQLQTARTRLTEAQETAANQDKEIADARTRQGEIDKVLAELDARRIELAREDQVRRLAGRIYGTDPEKVTVEQASSISAVWFGSLAALAALAGPLTAMVALALQHIGSGPRAESRLSRSIRRALVAWRRRLRKKTVSPTASEERIIKEILYVPVLTNDPDLVRQAISSDLPKEVADLVRLSIKEAPVGSPA